MFKPIETIYLKNFSNERKNYFSNESKQNIAQYVIFIIEKIVYYSQVHTYAHGK